MFIPFTVEIKIVLPKILSAWHRYCPVWLLTSVKMHTILYSTNYYVIYSW